MVKIKKYIEILQKVLTNNIYHDIIYLEKNINHKFLRGGQKYEKDFSERL